MGAIQRLCGSILLIENGMAGTIRPVKQVIDEYFN